MFVILAERFPDKLTAGEREWLRALRAPASSPKPKAAPKATSKFEGMGGKKDGTTWPEPGGWGSPERPYSSLSAMQNDCQELTTGLSPIPRDFSGRPRRGVDSTGDART